MASHNEFGTYAEKLAVDFLKRKGYKILDLNWRYSHLEADIIALNGIFLVVVEVKARNYFGDNFNEIISIKKQKNLIELAEKYLDKKNLDYEVRFDAIFVKKDKTNYKIQHIEGAFSSIF